jgi:hypothetical protein
VTGTGAPSLLLPFLEVIVLSWVAVAVYYVAMNKGPRARVATIFAIAPALLALPLLVPSGRPWSAFVRFFAGIHCALIWMKMWDFHLAFERCGRPRALSFLTFVGLGNPMHHVWRRVRSEPGPGTRRSAVRLLRGVAEFTLGLALMRWAFGADLGRYGFWLDHSVKFLSLYPLLEGTGMVIAALARIAGLPARDFFRDPIVSRTPAEFWRRYNRPVNQFFYENVFRPLAKRKAPLRGALLAFLLSGALHEYLLAIAIHRVEGYQMGFFLLHGVAAIATVRLKPTGAWAVGAAALNVLFTLGSLAIFSASAVPLLEGWLDVYPHGHPFR